MSIRQRFRAHRPFPLCHAIFCLPREPGTITVIPILRAAWLSLCCRMTRKSKAKEPKPKPARTYGKTALNIEQLLYHLWLKGLKIDDRDLNARSLRSIGYFRLLIYMRRFQNPATGKFRPRSRFSDIIDLYDFDRRLRTITGDAIERIEVGLRAALNSPLAIAHDPHWYLAHQRFRDLRLYSRTLDQIVRECGARKGPTLTHYYDTYATPELPPIWIVCERLSLGALSKMYESLATRERKIVGRYVWPEIPDTLLDGWLHSLTDLRNMCAHHARLWNRHITVSPPARPTGMKLARYGAEMIQPNSFYARATMIKALLDPLGHGVCWKQALRDTLSSCIHVDPGAHLGFSPGWETTAAWI